MEMISFLPYIIAFQTTIKAFLTQTMF